MQPVIGISAAVEVASYRSWVDVEVDLLPRGYAAAVERAGGIPVLLPAGDASADVVSTLLDRLDGVILSGGGDIGADAIAAGLPAVEGVRSRDAFEAALARAVVGASELPVLGVCRGFELLTVAGGGTLIDHIPDVTGSSLHLETPGTFAVHDVELEPDSLAALAAGGTVTTVRSHHHQGVDRLADGWRVTGRSPEDGVIEAIERDGHPFALAVLWHPEEDDASRVIESLVEAARRRIRRH